MADPEKESPEEAAEEPAGDKAEVQAAPEALVVEEAAAEFVESREPEASSVAEPTGGEAAAEGEAAVDAAEGRTADEHAQFEPHPRQVGINQQHAFERRDRAFEVARLCRQADKTEQHIEIGRLAQRFLESGVVLLLQFG